MNITTVPVFIDDHSRWYQGGNVEAIGVTSTDASHGKIFLKALSISVYRHKNFLRAHPMIYSLVYNRSDFIIAPQPVYSSIRTVSGIKQVA